MLIPIAYTTPCATRSKGNAGLEAVTEKTSRTFPPEDSSRILRTRRIKHTSPKRTRRAQGSITAMSQDRDQATVTAKVIEKVMAALEANRRSTPVSQRSPMVMRRSSCQERVPESRTYCLPGRYAPLRSVVRMKCDEIRDRPATFLMNQGKPTMERSTKSRRKVGGSGHALYATFSMLASSPSAPDIAIVLKLSNGQSSVCCLPPRRGFAPITATHRPSYVLTPVRHRIIADLLTVDPKPGWIFQLGGNLAAADSRFRPSSTLTTATREVLGRCALH